jgi:DNA-binding Xre family transcriptional regulator
MTEIKFRTKLEALLFEKDMLQKELFFLINDTYPEQPISMDSLNRYITGSRTNVQLSTIRRICNVLQCTPNEIID